MADDPGRPDDDSELTRSLSAALHPLDSVSPDANSDDLDAVGEAMASATVIGMGEASHGTREFFQLKHRLFRHLVEEQGVRMLGLEANFAAMLDVNDYVVRGAGTAEEALSRDGIHGPYRTGSVLGLVEWMRSFNEDRPPDDRIRFHGFDVQYSSAAASKLQAYFETVDPDALATVRKSLDHLASHGAPDFSDDEELRTHLEAREAVVSTLGDALDEHEAAYVDATTTKKHRLARRLVWTIERGREQFEAIRQGRTDTGYNVRVRDSAMAAQVQWLLRHEPADRMALWGHNAHLTRGTFGGGTVRHTQGIPSLGGNLASIGSVDYYALGLVLGGGTVRAMYVPEREFRAYEIEDPPEGSVPDVFGRVEEPLFFLDLAGLPAESPLAEWLDTGPLQYDVEGGYEDTPVNLVESDLRSQFDGLVFAGETTAARSLSAGNGA